MFLFGLDFGALPAGCSGMCEVLNIFKVIKMNLADFANTISNILCGHGGASEEAIIEKAKELKNLEEQINRHKNRNQIKEAIANLEDAFNKLEDAEFELFGE